MANTFASNGIPTRRHLEAGVTGTLTVSEHKLWQEMNVAAPIAAINTQD